MRRIVMAAFITLLPFAGAHAAAVAAGSEPVRVTQTRADGAYAVAQYTGPRAGARPRAKVRPYGRPGYARPGYVRPGAAYRPRPGVAYRPRPGVAHWPGYRPPGPGWRPGPGAWRPAYPGWRPGWAPAPWYGNYWRPGYGWGVAAGLVAVGVLAATAAMAYSVPPPPNPNLCWFYTDQTYQTGYWAACPPPL